MKKRVLAWIMTFIIVLGTMPTNVFAAGENDEMTCPEDQIGKHYQVIQPDIENNDPTDDGTYSGIPTLDRFINNPPISNTFVQDRSGDNWRVKVDKTIEATETENIFNITLSVQTKNEIRKIAEPIDSAVVLVFDLSSSMDNNLGNTNTKRIDAAKDAAQDFLELYAATQGGERKIAIVGFDKHANVKDSDGKNLADKEGKTINDGWFDAKVLAADYNEQAELAKVINGLEQGSGTNIEGGLLLAKNLLNSSAVENIKYKHIILLSDGAPYAYIDDDNIDSSAIYLEGKDASWTNYHPAHSQPKSIADEIMDSNIKLDAIYCGGTENISCYTSGCDYSSKSTLHLLNTLTTKGEAVAASNAGSLTEAFKTIQKEIEVATKVWESFDPMASNTYLSNLVSQNNTGVTTTGDNLSWNLSKAEPEVIGTGDNKIYKYSVTYKVKLDTLRPTFDHNTYYATNNPTSLSYFFEDDAGNIEPTQKIYFNIPTVRGAEGGYYQLMKVGVDGKTGLNGAKFELLHECENCYICESNSCANCDDKTTNNVGDGACIANWSKSCISGSQDAVDENGTPLGDGYVSFNNIPSGHTYTLVETSAPGEYYLDRVEHELKVAYGRVYIDDSDVAYDPENPDDPNKLVVINKPFTYTSVSGQKTWKGDTETLRPESINVNLYGYYDADGEGGEEGVYITEGYSTSSNKIPFDTKEVSASDDWSWNWEKLHKYYKSTETEADKINWFVEESGVPDGYVSEVKGYNIENRHMNYTDRKSVV